MKMLVWFMLGPIGAGKSTYIRTVILKKFKKLKYLSPDVLIEEKNLSYIEARQKVGKLMEKHVENHINFVIEGTGQNIDLYDLLLSYHKNPDIELKVTYIDVDLNIALKRNKMRKKRVLKDQVVKGVHERSQKWKNLWKDFNCVYLDYRDLLKDNLKNKDH